MVLEQSFLGSSSSEMVWGGIGDSSCDRLPNSSNGGVGGGTTTKQAIHDVSSRQFPITVNIKYNHRRFWFSKRLCYWRR